jgi:enterobactin synthetase component D
MQHLFRLSEPPGTSRTARPDGSRSGNLSAVPGLQEVPGGFLTGLRQFDSGFPDVTALRADYRADRFDQGLFDALGIYCPDALLTAGPKRRGEFLAGRMLARAALVLLGLPPVGIGIGAGGAPLWPAGVTGSISHSAGRCICLLRNDADSLLGADTEHCATGQARTAIKRLVLTDSERAMDPGPALPDFPALVFSAKETLFKLLHPVVRRHFGFACAELPDLPCGGILRLRLTRDLHRSLAAGAEFPIRYATDASHVTTWAVAGRPPR